MTTRVGASRSVTSSTAVIATGSRRWCLRVTVQPTDDGRAGMPIATEPDLLDETAALDHLIGLGILSHPPYSARSLGGGVSNVVLSCRDDERAVVVKQSLARLRVSAEWTAPRERVLTEAAALRLVATMTPDEVPQVLHVDSVLQAIVIAKAPEAWTDWKTQMLAGVVRPAIASRLGHLLAMWHTGTTASEISETPMFADPRAFESLRVDPYYRTVALSHPELADGIYSVIHRMTDTRICLVHGDFSPKNILVEDTGDQVWVIDFEVAHFGDPTFDVAFLISHLFLKSLHLPHLARELDDCAATFLASYRCAGGGFDPPYLFQQVGALLLARVFGKSPVEYLNSQQQDRAARIGAHLLKGTTSTYTELTELRERESGT
jgi:Phosphotransferase enzyme family